MEYTQAVGNGLLVWSLVFTVLSVFLFTTNAEKKKETPYISFVIVGGFALIPAFGCALLNL